MEAPAVRITVELRASEFEDLQELARRKGVSANDTVRAAIVTLKAIREARDSGSQVHVRQRLRRAAGGRCQG